MPIPTEPVGSIPRSPELVAAMQQFAAGRLSRDQLARLQDEGVRDTIKRFEATESPVISDGEQSKPSFATYPIHGLASLAPDGVTIPFADGHTRRLPRLTAGPFRYQTYADAYLVAARAHTRVPVKQAVIAASALSLLYPEDGIRGYPRDAFLQDLVREAETDIRRCLAAGAHVVQIDFTEGRLAVKLDPTKGVLKAFVDLNNRVLARFTTEERRRIGVHTCPGGDQDSTHVRAVGRVLVPAGTGMDADAAALLRGEASQHAVVQVHERLEHPLRGIELDREPALGEVDLDDVRARRQAAPDVRLRLAHEVLEERVARVSADAVLGIEQAQGRGRNHRLLDGHAGMSPRGHEIRIGVGLVAERPGGQAGEPPRVSVGERDGHAVGREAREPVNRVGGEAGLGLLPVADHRGLGRFEAFDGVTDALVLEPGELVAREAAGGELLHCRDELGGSGNAADGFGGNGHRARLSAGVAKSMALAPVL